MTNLLLQPSDAATVDSTILHAGPAVHCQACLGWAPFPLVPTLPRPWRRHSSRRPTVVYRAPRLLISPPSAASSSRLSPPLRRMCLQSHCIHDHHGGRGGVNSLSNNALNCVLPPLPLWTSPERTVKGMLKKWIKRVLFYEADYIHFCVAILIWSFVILWGRVLRRLTDRTNLYSSSPLSFAT